ncbi:MAG: hypothetical protein KJI70_02985 [Patescibacteria group bacterium]|nr:hypothetical protein [Patescibacteria group bacterium]
MKKIFNYLIIILTISAVAGLVWNWQKNVYSKELLVLEIIGPKEITLAEEVEYVVRYKNKGEFRLDNPELVFEAPEYSLKDNEFFERETLGQEELGEAIYPGEEKTFSFKISMLGKEGDIKIVKASLSYQPKDLRARYESSSEFTSQIKSAPITFDFDLPSKVASEKDFTFHINYFSNIDHILTNLISQVEYPVGFEFISSTPKSMEQTEWEIPLLNKSEGGRIKITGSLSGRLGEAKVFRAKLGVWKDGEFIVLKEASKGVEMVKHSLYVRQEINGNPQYVAVPGDWLHYEVYFKNSGEDSISNLFMVNQLEGEAFDFQTIQSDYGNFQAGDNSIVFDWRNVPDLQYLIPMEEGKVEFFIKLKDDLGTIRNPVLKNKVFIGQVKEEFVTKIGSKLDVDQKAYFQDDIFGNSGPIPPQVGIPTTYTITWHIRNHYSDVKNVKVKAVLPENVELNGSVFPQEQFEKFSFDSQSREILWLAGDLTKGVGVTEPPKTIAFKVVFTPDSTQRSTIPNLINQVTITGEDVWTETVVEGIDSAINTSLPDDSSVVNGVVQ